MPPAASARAPHDDAQNAPPRRHSPARPPAASSEAAPARQVAGAAPVRGWGRGAGHANLQGLAAADTWGDLHIHQLAVGPHHSVQRYESRDWDGVVYRVECASRKGRDHIIQNSLKE